MTIGFQGEYVAQEMDVVAVELIQNRRMPKSCEQAACIDSPMSVLTIASVSLHDGTRGGKERNIHLLFVTLGRIGLFGEDMTTFCGYDLAEDGLSLRSRKGPVIALVDHACEHAAEIVTLESLILW